MSVDDARPTAGRDDYGSSGPGLTRADSPPHHPPQPLLVSTQHVALPVEYARVPPPVVGCYRRTNPGTRGSRVSTVNWLEPYLSAMPVTTGRTASKPRAGVWRGAGGANRDRALGPCTSSVPGC